MLYPAELRRQMKFPVKIRIAAPYLPIIEDSIGTVNRFAVFFEGIEA